MAGHHQGAVVSKAVWSLPNTDDTALERLQSFDESIDTFDVQMIGRLMIPVTKY